jgi:hypothetical protein
VIHLQYLSKNEKNDSIVNITGEITQFRKIQLSPSLILPQGRRLQNALKIKGSYSTYRSFEFHSA